MKRLTTYLLIIGTMNLCAFAQEIDDLANLSLEELLDIQIFSVSKKSESFVDAPLSSSIITSEEIINSGATTIEEVFRLIPGVIVREETNGNFDIHIRGLDNVPPGSFSATTENVSTLVMIDGRRVYNSTNGGTFWETLPISLTDIEQIEIIRGPAQALYGPNAATGVINIITKNSLSEKKVSVHANLQGGTSNSIIGNTSFGIKASEKLNFIGSVNYDRRDRFQDTYYNYVFGAYTPREGVSDYLSSNPTSPIGNFAERYPDPNLAKEKIGLNLNSHYQVNDEVDINTTLSYQDSKAQVIFYETSQSPLSQRISESYSADIAINAYGLSAQVSHINGTQDINEGVDVDFDFNTTDITLEYDFFRRNDNLSIRPGFQYQLNNFDDEPARQKLTNRDRKLTNIAFFVRGDYNINDSWRVIAAVRNDAYNEPSDLYLSYQFATTYKFSENNLVRAVASRAYRGSTIAQMFIDFASSGLQISGNRDLRLQQVDLYELGARNTIGEYVQTNVELFHTRSSDFSELLIGDLELIFAPDMMTIIGATQNIGYENYPTKVVQNGITAEVTVVPSSKFRATLFGTYQQTDIENALRLIPDTDPTNFSGLTTELYDTENERTPDFFGGAKLSWSPITKLNLYSNIYFYSENTWVYADQVGLSGLDNRSEVESKARVDMKISYNVFGESRLFFNGRNLFNNDKDEFGWSDNIEGLYLFGIDLRL